MADRKSTCVLIKVDDSNIVRHGTLAYVDGYADARESGEAGFFMSANYLRSERENYVNGFKKGLRVHRVANGRPTADLTAGGV